MAGGGCASQILAAGASAKKIEPTELGVKLMPEYKYKCILVIGDIYGKYSDFMHLWSKVGFCHGEDCVILAIC